MNKAPEEVIRRLKKLEAMADKSGGASEGEIANALRAVRSIRDKYDISDAELWDEPSRVTIVDETAMEWNRVVQFQKALAWPVSMLFDCKWYLGNNDKGYTKAGTRRIYKGIRFVGTERDVAVACQVYETAYYTLRLMMTMKYGGGNWTVQHRSYAEGICRTLFERVKEIKKEMDKPAATGAIVLVKDALVKDFYSRLGLRSLKRSSQNVDPNAYRNGRVDGKNVDLTPSDRKCRKSTTKMLR